MLDFPSPTPPAAETAERPLFRLLLAGRVALALLPMLACALALAVLSPATPPAAEGLAAALQLRITRYLGEQAAALDSLAASAALEHDDLPSFAAQATRVMARRPGWLSLAVAEPGRPPRWLAAPLGGATGPGEGLELRTTNGLPAGREVRLEVSATALVPLLAEAAMPAAAFALVLDPTGRPQGHAGAAVPPGVSLDGGARLGWQVARARLSPDGWTVAVGLPTTGARWPAGLAMTAAVGLGLLLWLHSGQLARAALARRTAEAALASSTAARQGEYLARMSHELRTPVTGLLGFAELLEGSALSAEQRGWVAQQRAAGRTLLRLVGEVLDATRTLHGRVQLERAAFALPRLLRDCTALLQPVAARQGLVLNTSLAPGVPAVVWGDPLRLRQIVTNLLGNALKFTATGEVALAATAEPSPDGRVMLRLVVSDTGLGIRPERLAHIFEPFGPVTRATSDALGEAGGLGGRGLGGSGLGLAITRQLVVAMGGTISAESQPGRGSRFTVQVPLWPAPRPDGPASTQVEPPPAAPAHILVAEDSACNQALLKGLLEQAGHRVTTCANGAVAVMLLRRDGADAAVLDLHMPLLDGPGAARAIRALPGPLGALPLLALTADTTAEAFAACRAAGFDAVLTKPFAAERLLAELSRLLARRQVVGGDKVSPR